MSDFATSLTRAINADTTERFVACITWNLRQCFCYADQWWTQPLTICHCPCLGRPTINGRQVTLYCSNKLNKLAKQTNWSTLETLVLKSRSFSKVLLTDHTNSSQRMKLFRMRTVSRLLVNKSPLLLPACEATCYGAYLSSLLPAFQASSSTSGSLWSRAHRHVQSNASHHHCRAFRMQICSFLNAIH